MTQMPPPDAMAYTHLRAWRVIGGIGMPPSSNEILLASGEGWSYSLTNDIDAACAISDRGIALGHLALQGTFGPAKVGTLEERLASAIKEIQQARREKTGCYPLLLFMGKGCADVTIGKSAQQRDDYILTFDAYDKAGIRQEHIQQHRAMQLSLALEAKTRIRFDEVSAGTYCTNAEGHTVYSLSFSSNAELTESSPLAAEIPEAISRRFALLSKSAELASSIRLYADMATYGREPFRVFISGWTALEILINKTFKEYEERFFSTLEIPHQPEMADKFLASIRQTMSNKHNLVDRFTLVSAVLLPSQDSGEAEADLTTFKRIKVQRDKIAHGEAFDESHLPVDDLSGLLMKYMAAHSAKVADAATLPRSRA